MSISTEIDSSPRSGEVLALQEVSLVFNEGRSTEVRALRDVTFRVNTKEFIGVLGPSGSGKTSLLEVAAGLRQPTHGSIRLAGTELAGISKHRIEAVRRQSVRFIFQSDNLVPYLTALENVQIMGRISDGTKMDPALALSLLEKLEIPPAMSKRLPRELSGGQQQRIAIARALVGKPSLILADEPTARLDRHTASASLQALRLAAELSGASLIIVSHDEELIGTICDRITHLKDGQIANQ